MGCWAVPTVAAEVWGVPLQIVLDAIEDGTVLSKTEAGMILVDVDPNGIGAARRRIDQRPPTFSIVTTEDLNARHEPAIPLSGTRLRGYFKAPRSHAARIRRSPHRKLESLRH